MKGLNVNITLTSWLKLCVLQRFAVCMMFVQREKCPSPPGSAVEKDGLRAVPSVADGLDGQHHVQHDPGVDVTGWSGRTSLYAGAYESWIHMEIWKRDNDCAINLTPHMLSLLS